MVLSSGGRPFHSVGPYVEKSLSPLLTNLMEGISNMLRPFDRRLLGLESLTSLFARQQGQFCHIGVRIKVATLKSTLNLMGNQCKSTNAEEVCRVVSLAGQFQVWPRHSGSSVAWIGLLLTYLHRPRNSSPSVRSLVH